MYTQMAFIAISVVLLFEVSNKYLYNATYYNAITFFESVTIFVTNHPTLMHRASPSIRCIKCISTSRCITVHHGASQGRCCGASWCIILHHGVQKRTRLEATPRPRYWHVSCVLCSFSTTAASYEPTLGVWVGVSPRIQKRSPNVDSYPKHIQNHIF